MLFVSSWSITFVAFPGLAAYFYYLVLLIVSVLFNIGKFATLIKSPRYVIFAALFAIWIVWTGIVSISGQWYDSLKVSFYIIPLVIFSRFRLRDSDFLKQSLIVVAAFFSVYFLFVSLFAPVEFINELTEIKELYSSPSLRRDMNPNTAAQVVMIIFTILLCGTFATKKHWLIGFAMLNLFTLMYLGSRTAFFTVCIIAIVYLIMVLKTSIIKKSFLILLVAALFYGVFSMNDMFERAERLSMTSVQEDEGSGRFLRWTLLFKYAIPQNYIMGFGHGNKNFEYFGLPGDADNMYIDLLCQTGIIGLVLFLTFYIITIVLLWNKRNLNRDWDFLIAIFLALLVEGFGETVFDTPLFWFCGLMAVLVINEKNYIQNKETQINL